MGQTTSKGAPPLAPQISPTSVPLIRAPRSLQGALCEAGKQLVLGMYAIGNQAYDPSVEQALQEVVASLQLESACLQTEVGSALLQLAARMADVVRTKPIQREQLRSLLEQWRPGQNDYLFWVDAQNRLDAIEAAQSRRAPAAVDGWWLGNFGQGPVLMVQSLETPNAHSYVGPAELEGARSISKRQLGRPSGAWIQSLIDSGVDAALVDSLLQPDAPLPRQLLTFQQDYGITNQPPPTLRSQWPPPVGRSAMFSQWNPF